MSAPEVEIREAADADLALLLAFERPIQEALHWSETAWRGVLASARSSGDPAQLPMRLVLIAFVTRQPAGVLVLQRVRDVAEIESLIVAREHRRQGIARMLCTHAIAWARAGNAAAIELEVRASNQAAQALYGSLGFERQGRRRGYYTAPAEDAVLMRAWLQPPAGPGA